MGVAVTAPITELRLGDEVFSNFSSTLTFDVEGIPIFELRRKAGDFAFWMNTATEATATVHNQNIELLLFNASHNSNGEHVLHFRPAIRPVVLRQGDFFNRTTVKILRPPEFFQPVSLTSAAGVVFEIPKVRKKDELIEVSVLFPERRSTNQFIEEHSEFMHFLIFMKGGSCGFGNYLGWDGKDVTVECIGFNLADRARRSNWSAYQSDLRAIFHQFSSACSDADARRVLFRAIEFYRAANVSIDVTMELSIVAAQAALETLTGSILTTKAGWSKRLADDKRISFADKLRAAAGFFGLTDDLGEKSVHFLGAQFERGRPATNIFEKITAIRNSVVHENANAGLNGLQMYDGLNLMLWLSEALIFGLIGYTGVVGDRRITQGFVGQSSDLGLRL